MKGPKWWQQEYDDDIMLYYVQEGPCYTGQYTKRVLQTPSAAGKTVTHSLASDEKGLSPGPSSHCDVLGVPTGDET